MTHFGHSVGRAFGPVVLPDGPYAFRATDIPRRKTEMDQCVPLIVLAFTSDPAARWMDRKLDQGANRLSCRLGSAWRLEWGLRANRLVVISDPVIEIPDLGTVLVESLLSDGPQSIKMIRQRLNGYSPPRLQT